MFDRHTVRKRGEQYGTNFPLPLSRSVSSALILFLFINLKDKDIHTHVLLSNETKGKCEKIVTGESRDINYTDIGNFQEVLGRTTTTLLRTISTYLIVGGGGQQYDTRVIACLNQILNMLLN